LKEDAKLRFKEKLGGNDFDLIMYAQGQEFKLDNEYTF